MNRRQVLFTALIITLLAMATACGGRGNPPTATPANETADPVEEAVRQTLVAISVAQTVDAATNGQQPSASPPAPTDAPPPSDAPSPTPTLPPSDAPSPTDAPSPSDAPSPTAAQKLICTTRTATNARSGPGTVFDPPIGSIPANTELRPLSFVPNGFPGGQWLEAEVVSNGQTVWVTAEAQFVSCNFDLASLPAPATLPPTPRPKATATPPAPTPTQVVAGLPPDVSNNTPGGACENAPNIVAPPPVIDPTYLLRVMTHDLREGEYDGAGIDYVGFQVFQNFGNFDQVYSREERTAGFCIFRGGEPNCNPWFYDAQGRATWGEGGRVVESGDYHISVNIVSKFPPEGSPAGSDGETCNWDFDITVNVKP